jgi:tripartite-type tricarboxylate transporter receptor subunit TctC
MIPLSPKIAARLMLVAAVGGLALALPARAQAPYPNKPVTVINPWAAGGPSDSVIRPIADQLSKRLGQPFLIDNRSGANGTIGAEAVARAKPDGYTLFFAHVGPIAISPALPNKLAYDPVKDFAPITQIVSGATVLVVRPDFPATTLGELVAYAKKNPGRVTYGSVGIGSTTHLAGATLAHMTNIDMTHVPYRGSSLINTALLGGHLSAAFVGVAGAVGLVRDGKLRALAISTARRTSTLPNVPAVAEMFPGFDMNSWYGLMAPANTPPAIIQKLYEEVVQILKMPDIVERIKNNGMDIEGTTPAAFAAKIKSDLGLWATAVKAADIKE